MTPADGRLFLVFYGDDFTGSTDALESLVLNGIPSMLFLQPPNRDDLRTRYAHLQAIGVAGGARSMTPAEMRAQLPELFERLAALRPVNFHYKACSTFDSAPEIGNLGVAAELAAEAFRDRTVYALGGAPHLGRYMVFGHLFARYGETGKVYRIDRHPVMRNHPTTPMRESDLVRHLGKQNAALDVVSISFEELRRRTHQQLLSEPNLTGGRKRLVIFDALTQEDCSHFADVIHEAVRKTGAAVLLGPSSVESALASCWPNRGAGGDSSVQRAVNGVDRLLVLSGSCSPVTTQQTQYAVERGFVHVQLNPFELSSGRASSAATYLDMVPQLQSGRSIIVTTCHDGQQPADKRRVLPEDIASAFVALLDRIMDEHPFGRIVLAGGDTSSLTLQGLPVTALEMLAPIAPGAPLCRLHSGNPPWDGVEIALKGGQLGGEDYFVRLRDGNT